MMMLEVHYIDIVRLLLGNTCLEGGSDEVDDALKSLFQM